MDIYSSLHLEHGDWLNAPWGVAVAPSDFGRFSHSLLIGQFAGGGDTQSSAHIAAYDLTTGKFNGLLGRSALTILIPEAGLPRRCISPPDRAMAPEGCLLRVPEASVMLP